MLAAVTKEEADRSYREAAFAKEIGRFSSIYREGEIVAISETARVYRLNERTTGDDRAGVERFLKKLDRTQLQGIEATKQVMYDRAEAREAYAQLSAIVNPVKPREQRVIDPRPTGRLGSSMGGRDNIHAPAAIGRAAVRTIAKAFDLRRRLCPSKNSKARSRRRSARLRPSRRSISPNTPTPMPRRSETRTTSAKSPGNNSAPRNETETDESRRTCPILRQQPPGDKNQKASGLADALRRQFRAVMKALTRAPEPRPQARRRRRTEETGRAFRMTARKLLRRAVRIPVEAYARATGYLADTLDWLNLWHHGDQHFTEDVHHAPSDHLYPHL